MPDLRRKLTLRINNLRNAVLAFVLVPLLGVLLGLGLLGLREVEREMERRLQDDVELIARSIQLPISQAMARRDEGSVQQALDSTFQLEQVFGVYVYDSGGSLLATSGPRSPSLDRRRDARQITATGSQGAFDQRRGREVFSFFLPLSDAGGRIIGLLQVTRDVSPFTAYLARIRGQGAAAIGVLALIFFLVVVIGHHRAVGRHVTGMTTAMKRMGEGIPGQRVPAEGPQELRLLADSMNQMILRREQFEHALEVQRAQQAELRERLRQSEKLAAIGQLAAGVAHELGTPLGVIGGRVQRARRGLEGDGRADSELQGVLGELGRVDHIVRQLLDFARQSPINRSPVRVSVLVTEVVDRVRMGVSRPTVTVELVPPKTAGSDCVQGDRARLEQAIGNLVENALHAARARVSIVWTWVQKTSGNEWELAVTDDGEGVPEAQRHRLFEPFFTTKPVGWGTGLGLALAHAAVADHGGRIWLDPRWKQGSRFVMRLPVDAGEPA